MIADVGENGRWYPARMRAFDLIRARSARLHVDRLRAAATTYRSLTAAVDDAPPAEETAALSNRWEGPITFEGQITGDGRMLENGSLYWPEDLSESNPLDFRTVFEDVGFHDNAFVTGHIFGIERRAGGMIWAWGDYDLGSEHGLEARRLLAEKLMRGVSVDLDDVAFEVRVARELLEDSEVEAEVEIVASAGDDPAKSGRDYEVVWESKPDDEIMVTTSARIRSATQVSIPAFALALINLTEGDAPQPVENTVENDAEAIVAAAAPIDPPRAWFDDPKLDGPTPIVVTDDGQVYGHLATWDVCHVASPAGEGVCITAPHSNTGYARFHLGSLRTAEGGTISVGKLTMGTGHAGPRATPAQTVAHYDNTGAAVADVRAGEDVYGIWVAGAMRPDATDEQIRALRASPLSGDWRKVDGNLELHGALAVNVPGFPVVPRPIGLVASGELTSLVATGLVVTDETVDRAEARHDFGGLTDDDLGYLRRLADRERQEELAARRDAVNAFANRRRVEAFAATRRAS